MGFFLGIISALATSAQNTLYGGLKKEDPFLIGRLSLVFDVILGRVIHHEDNFRERMAGAFFMIAGVILIAFG